MIADLRRALFKPLPGLSAVLFLSMLVLWERSYSRAIYPQFHPLLTCGIGFYALDGQVRFFFSTHPKVPAKSRFDFWLEPIAQRSASANRIQLPFPRPWFSTDHDQNGVGGAWWGITVPIAILPGFFGFTGALGLWLSVVRSRWRNTGFCQNCGYDLRATPSRCPECGTAANEVSTFH